jgi:hypothetical protein
MSSMTSPRIDALLRSCQEIALDDGERDDPRPAFRGEAGWQARTQHLALTFERRTLRDSQRDIDRISACSHDNSPSGMSLDKRLLQLYRRRDDDGLAGLVMSPGLGEAPTARLRHSDLASLSLSARQSLEHCAARYNRS